ncbi:MAG: hypothetical protein ABJB66_07505 [Gemmatimonadaceae bacterium]
MTRSLAQGTMLVMTFAPQITVWLLQAATLPDTIVAKTMPAQRSWFDYTSGTLQLIVLILAVVVLAALAIMLVSLKRGLDSLKTTVEKLYADSKPIVQQAGHVAADAREVMAMLRTDVERISSAAEEVSAQMLDIAATTERRMDDINAVIDVVQGELEETVLSTTAALRGVRLGGRAIAGALGRKKKKGLRRARADDEEAY